jgi:hypothetical protein
MSVVEILLYPNLLETVAISAFWLINNVAFVCGNPNKLDSYPEVSIADWDYLASFLT